MLRICLLGQFDARYDGKAIRIPSRPAQSLLSYLVLSAGIAHRREKLAGLLWPDSTDTNARTYLRQALWRLRKSLSIPPVSWSDYLRIDDIEVAFRKDSSYWVDSDVLTRLAPGKCTVEQLIEAVSVYQGELLPGFYEEWTVLEREHLQSAFDLKMRVLLDRLAGDASWSEVVQWGERWITLSYVPEHAYVALMVAQAGMGNLSAVTTVYNRLARALNRGLGVEPTEELRVLHTQLAQGNIPPDCLAPLERREVSADGFPPAQGEPPFKGLQFYSVADSHMFFGRDALIQELVQRLEEHRFLIVVVGASGSGKSSLVRAGLVPRLLEDNDDCPVHIITPTAHPLEALALSLARDSESTTAVATLMDDLARDARCLHLFTRRQANAKGTRRLLLVVDQFEELFTLCRDEAERGTFIENLLLAADPETDCPITIVITLRADFYSHCAEHPGLRRALTDHQVYMGPMSAQELRRAIEGPARQGDWEFQPGLVDLIMRDVHGEPGALPLLSHALLETWHRRSGRTLTLKGYAESGGVHSAIASTAESVYNLQLSSEQQAMARDIFLRLTELGEGTEATRRRVANTELVPDPEAAPKVQTVLDTLARARLITLDEDTVEVAHEALIRHWPTLRRWLDEDRKGLQMHRQLTEAAQHWEELECDPGALYRGARLSQVADWVQVNPGRLNVLEQTFLEASLALEKQEEADREAQRQREVDAALKLAEAEHERAEVQARASRRLRWFALGLGVTLILSLITAVFAAQQSSLAEREAHIATARELAAAAVTSLEIDPELGILLAMEAVSETASVGLAVEPDAQNALHRALVASRVELVLRDHTQRVNNVCFSPDGTRIVTAGCDGKVRVWDSDTGEKLLAFSSAVGGFSDVAFSPDGTRFVTAGDDGRLVVWDRASGEQMLSIHADRLRVLSCAFSPDGTRILSGGGEGTARLWDAFTGEKLLELTGYTDGVMGVAFSSDGSSLAASSLDGTVRTYAVPSGEELLSVTAYPGRLFRVIFSTDGKRLVASEYVGSTVRTWDAATGEELPPLQGHRGSVYAVAFSRDGRLIATGADDREAKIWDAQTGRELLCLTGHIGPVLGVAFDPRSPRLATAASDGEVRLWNIGANSELLAVPAPQGVFRFSYSPDGLRLAAGPTEDGAVWIWDARTGERVRMLPAVVHTARVSSVAYSPDGSYLATGGDDTTAVLWNLASGEPQLTLEGHRDWINDVAFSPDGSRLATGSRDWLAIVWDTRTGEKLATISEQADVVEALAFIANGTRLVTAGGSAGTANIWDLSSLERVVTLQGHTQPIYDLDASPDGTLIATASDDGTARIWDAATGTTRSTLVGHTASVVGVAFSPDGSRLATASMDGTAKIWDVYTADELVGLPVADDTWVSSVAFSPDGEQLAVSSGHGIHLYVTHADDLISLAHQRLTRGFTPEECERYLRRETCAATPPTPLSTAEDQEEAEAAGGKVCEVTDCAGLYDLSFNQRAYKGIQDVVEKLDWESAVFLPQIDADLPIKIKEALEADCDLIVATSLWARDPIAVAAAAHPDRLFLTLDADCDPPLGNAWGEIYATDQAAFLAGYVAASVTRSGRVATFGGIPVPPVLEFMIGFEQGVRHYNQIHGVSIDVIGWSSETGEGSFIGDFCCADDGYAAAARLLEGGADVIMPVAGPFVGAGAAARIKEWGSAYVIGVDTDWVLSFPQFAGIVLTSVEKKVDASVLSAVEAIANGTFEGGTHVGTLANGRVGLAPFHSLEGLVSEQVKAELQQIEADIIAGKIKTMP